MPAIASLRAKRKPAAISRALLRNSVFDTLPANIGMAIAATIAATNLDTVVGKVQWGSASLPPFAAKNVAKTPLVGGQWRFKDGKYDIVITDNKTAPEIPVGGKMEPIA